MQEKREIKDIVLELLKAFDIEEEEVLANTPKRVSKALMELWRGLIEPPPKLAFFPAKKGMTIIVEDISFNSTCEHHLMPFFGTCKITLKSNGTTLGLSKFNRIVQYFASKPTIQEKMAQEIHDFLKEHLKPEYLEIEIKAKHTCVSHRGIKDACSNTIVVIESFS